MNLDRFLVVYDLRNMQQLTPVPVFIDPCFLHYHTMTSTSVMVASQVNSSSMLWLMPLWLSGYVIWHVLPNYGVRISAPLDME